MAAVPTPFIEFRDVSVEYPGYVKALCGVSLQISRGEFVFLVGKTGAGKSTLLKLLTRELKATSGEVILDGRDVARLGLFGIPGLRRGMGIVPQDFALLPRKTVWENIAYAMRASGATRRQVRRRVPEILESVNIGHRADAFPHQLSGGEQQRVAIGRALVNNPPLLLADEPTGNLDPQHSMEIMDLLIDLNHLGTTVVVASHDMMIVERLRKRTVRMEEGQVSDDNLVTQPVIPGFDWTEDFGKVTSESPSLVEAMIVSACEDEATTLRVEEGGNA